LTISEKESLPAVTLGNGTGRQVRDPMSDSGFPNPQGLTDRFSEIVKQLVSGLFENRSRP
jgi:hypothetical protein